MMTPTDRTSVDGVIRSCEGALRCVVLAREAPNCGMAVEFASIEARWWLTASWHAGALLVGGGVDDSLVAQYATLARVVA